MDKKYFSSLFVSASDAIPITFTIRQAPSSPDALSDEPNRLFPISAAAVLHALIKASSVKSS